jgi:uncharacterized protein
VKFEWDSRKARFNRVKHRVTFEGALTVFADPLAKIFDDVDHAESEAREIIVGHSVKQRVLLVSFFGSSRVATRTERRAHEEGSS